MFLAFKNGVKSIQTAGIMAVNSVFRTASAKLAVQKYSPDWQINKRLQLQKQPKVDKFLWSSFYVDSDSDVLLKNFRPFILSMAIRVVEFSNRGYKIRKI